jgi:hypothetical protein
MSEIKHGAVTVTIPDELAPPPEAGSLTPEEVRRIPKAPRGIGLICATAADALEKAGGRLAAPADVSPSSLRASGQRAEDVDQILADLDVVTNKLKQANILFDADAWEQVRKLHDQVKAQGKHDPELLVMFGGLLDVFARGPRQPAAVPPAPTGPQPAPAVAR